MFSFKKIFPAITNGKIKSLYMTCLPGYPFIAWLFSQPTRLNIQEAGPAVQYIDHGTGGDIQLSKKQIWATISWKQEVLCGTIYLCRHADYKQTEVW